MRAGAVRWTLLQRGVIEATKASLGVGKPDRPLPRNIEGFLERLQQAATDPTARRDFLVALAGPAKTGVASTSGRLAVFDAGMFAATGHMDLAIANAQTQARHDPDCSELVDHRKGLKRSLAETAKVVREQIERGE